MLSAVGRSRYGPAVIWAASVAPAALFGVGATLSLMVVYAERTLSGDIIPYPESYAVIEAAIGVGNLAGKGIIINSCYFCRPMHCCSNSEKACACTKIENRVYFNFRSSAVSKQ